MPTPLPHPLCEHLRSKKLYMVDDGREVCLEDLQTAGYHNYWCLHTHTDTGRDGGWVTYDRCAPGRACYEAMAQSTGARSSEPSTSSEWPDPYAVHADEGAEGPECPARAEGADDMNGSESAEPAPRPTFVELLRKRSAVPRA